MKINIFHPPLRFSPSAIKLNQRIRKVINREGKKFRELNIVFLSDKKIQALNRKFLKRDYPTDVISFQLEAGYGEIYLAKEQIVDKHHLLELVFHGLLHLIGYDHKHNKDKRIMDAKIRTCLNDLPH